MYVILLTFLISILQAGSHYAQITVSVRAFGQTFVLRLIKNRLIFLTIY